MRIAVARETDPAEDRVAATPDTVKKLKALGTEVAVEPGAGVKSGIPDGEFAGAGANVANDAINAADVVLKVRRPAATELAGTYTQNERTAPLTFRRAAAGARQ